MKTTNTSLNRAALFFVTTALLGFVLIGCRKKNDSSKTSSAPGQEQGNATQPPPAPTVVFSSFGPANTCNTSNRWGIGIHAHAEWFVPKVSGQLNSIELAIKPGSSSAEIFLAQDTNRFPGTVLENFTVAADSLDAKSVVTVVLQSVAHPMLQAGVKYWVGARAAGSGDWTWNFNDQKIVQSAAREPEPGKWMSAGDFCYVGAYSVTVTTNH
ncbi:MAG TPA: hypothetical protein VF437_10460 [Verrucomicrobiae bacterium]